MKLTRTFWKLLAAYEQHPRYIDSAGGTRSGKTFSALQLLIFLALSDKTPTLTSVVSETFPHLKRGAIRDFKVILGDQFNENAWSATDNLYAFPNGSKIEFFSADQPSKVHGPARDRLFINEAVNIPYETARQLFVRTRGFILCDYNPTHAFWMHEHIQPRPECVSIKTTYRDNDFLTPLQVAEIESNKTDKKWWKVYGEGEVGQLEGLVYEFEQIDMMPEPDGFVETIGMDFGFTNDPTAIVHILADTGRKHLYIDELCYRTHMLNSDIIHELKDIPHRVEIYADCAEPKSIAEIRTAGINIRPCDKDAPVKSEKLTFQIQWLQGWKMFVTKRSLNIIHELRNYTWAKDADGNALNHPIDKYNHALDALRYGAYTKLAQRANKGQYTISIL